MLQAELLSHIPSPLQRPTEWQAILSHTHTYSGRSDHGGTVKPPESYERLAAWTRRLGIAAVGMGSPYTLETARLYDRFDGDERGQYYGGDFNQTAVRGDEEIVAMLREVSEFSDGSTLFFLDNETPKARYGHLWWVNWALDFPAWHDYDQDYDRWMVHQARPEDDGQPEPMPHLRRPYREIVATQRAQGALANWAHPTSWWRGQNGQFITNLATEMPAHLIADGFLDGLVVMGYHAHRPEYQNLWFSLLDRGYRVPGVAEMDCGLSDRGLWEKGNAYLTWIHAPHPLQTAADIAHCWQSGRLVASSGPWLDLKVDGAPMGAITATSPSASHRVTLQFGGTDAHWSGDIELVGRGGQILWTGHGMTAGKLEISFPGLGERGYLVARLFSLRADGMRDLEQTAISNPVYLHPRGQSFEAPATTEISLRFDAISPWRGGQICFETANGESMGEAPIAASMRETLPAGSRFTLVNTDGCQETHYLINANVALQNVQRYLYRGGFTRDFPQLKSGELPPEVWHFDDYLAAMRTLALNF